MDVTCDHSLALKVVQLQRDRLSAGRADRKISDRNAVPKRLVSGSGEDCVSLKEAVVGMESADRGVVEKEPRSRDNIDPPVARLGPLFAHLKWVCGGC